MKTLKHLLAAALLLVTLSSCVFTVNGGTIGKNKLVRGNGVITTQTLDVVDFQSIVIHGAMDVVYTQAPGAAPVVVLTADENLVQYYDIKVVDGVLHIGTVKGVSVSSKNDPRISVSSSTLNGIKVSGSGDCEIKGVLSTDDFNFTLSGSGDLEADNIVCNSFAAKISGSGDIDVDALTAKTTDLSISGSGDIELDCVNAGDVTVKINGSGDISLKGRATSLSSKVNGSGDVDTRELQIYK